jgi:uncharacterized protein YecE (DUF72 family)
VTTVFTESDEYPPIADATGPFVYARVMRTEPQWAHGLAEPVLDAIGECALLWREGAEPAGLPRIEPGPAPKTAPRDVFVFFISGAKEKAPAAAVALRRRLEG